MRGGVREAPGMNSGVTPGRGPAGALTYPSSFRAASGARPRSRCTWTGRFGARARPARCCREGRAQGRSEGSPSETQKRQ